VDDAYLVIDGQAAQHADVALGREELFLGSAFAVNAVRFIAWKPAVGTHVGHDCLLESLPILSLIGANGSSPVGAISF
jgi:hypothetical protein